MEEGRWYIVYVDLDEKTDRLFASNRVESYLQNDELTVKEGDEVDLIIQQKTDLGYAVIINHIHRGLIYDNEIFQGDPHRGQAKRICEKGPGRQKIDLCLQPLVTRVPTMPTVS